MGLQREQILRRRTTTDRRKSETDKGQSVPSNCASVRRPAETPRPSGCVSHVCTTRYAFTPQSGLELVLGLGMLCTQCRNELSGEAIRRPRHDWQAGRHSSLSSSRHCMLCGYPVRTSGVTSGIDRVARRMSQLAWFGLSVGGPPLLERSRANGETHPFLDPR